MFLCGMPNIYNYSEYEGAVEAVACEYLILLKVLWGGYSYFIFSHCVNGTNKLDCALWCNLCLSCWHYALIL